MDILQVEEVELVDILALDSEEVDDQGEWETPDLRLGINNLFQHLMSLVTSMKANMSLGYFSPLETNNLSVKWASCLWLLAGVLDSHRWMEGEPGSTPFSSRP